MADEKKTSVKPRGRPLRGAIDGKPFSKDNQPTPAAKSAGWQLRRSQRYLTQEILKKMLGVDKVTGKQTLAKYVDALYMLATESGNSKAIETINNGIEDDIKKVELTGADGNELNFTVTLKL